MAPKMPRCALTIAGSDSSGGGGIQADLKTFADLRIHGLTVITAVTAQNADVVHLVEPIPVAAVVGQLNGILADFKVHAIKIGMLGTGDHVRAVTEVLAALSDPPQIVLDPVLTSTAGTELLDDDGIESLEQLSQIATVVTPNRLEAARLANCSVLDTEAQELWARSRSYPVLLKGAHLPGPTITDWLFIPGREEPQTWSAARTPGERRGTGCVLSAAITANLVRGADLSLATETAIAYTRQLIRLAKTPFLHDPGTM